MARMDNLDTLFVVTAFLFQLVLIVHFSLRKWAFNTALRYGPVVYAMAVPAALVSGFILGGGKTWSLWLGGFLYLAWAVFGYVVEYILKIEWRNSIRWSVLGPYVFLYLVTSMFYWFPLALIYKPFWYVYALLFVAVTILNVTSHKDPNAERRSA
jgi:hypothetical protein